MTHEKIKTNSIINLSLFLLENYRFFSWQASLNDKNIPYSTESLDLSPAYEVIRNVMDSKLYKFKDFARDSNEEQVNALIGIIDKTIEGVKRYPKKGCTYHIILYHCYLSDKELAVFELKQVIAADPNGCSERFFYQYKKEALEVFSTALTKIISEPRLSA